MSDFLLSSEVARLLRKSVGMVHIYARTGQLPAIRTNSGVRLFKRDDVLRFAEMLAERHGQKAEAVGAGVPDDAA